MKPVDETVYAIAQRVRTFLEARYGAHFKALILYGSYARGTATEASDIDLLAVVDDALDPWTVHESLDALLFELMLETGHLVSVVVVPWRRYSQQDSPFMANVHQEGIQV